MVRLMPVLSRALLAALVLAHGALAAQALPYDALADARADLNLALGRARTENKSVLVIFGANWCPDCRALANLMAAGTVAEHVSRRFVVAKVDVGRFDKNIDLSRQMGNVTAQGIPAAALLAADGSVVGSTRAGELSSARQMNEAQVLKVFERLDKAAKR